MDRKQFWGLIEAVNNKADVNDQEAVLKATREALCELSSGEIVEWYEVYRELHKEAYRDDLWIVTVACGIHATDDGFIDFRAWLISRGQAVYEAVMAEPKSLPAYVPNPRAANFELYGYVSADAFAEKACREALGNAGFEGYKNKWLYDHRAAIEENAEWNGSTVEVAGERLFYSELVGKYDIYKKPSDIAKVQADGMVISDRELVDALVELYKERWTPDTADGLFEEISNVYGPAIAQFAAKDLEEEYKSWFEAADTVDALIEEAHEKSEIEFRDGDCKKEDKGLF